jgi:hypothetical protein
MIENSWFYYFSSLAQAVAACSALLVAIALIRLQYLTNALNAIERLIAEAFYRITEHAVYQKEASPYHLNESWRIYFENVQTLVEKFQHKFKPLGDYLHSKEFVLSLLEHGRKLESDKRELHRSLTNAFGGTVLFAGAAILAIPLAQWISSWMLWIAWGISGFILAILFILYCRLVFDALKPKA